MGFLSKYEPYFYALLRIVSGFLFMWHGSQKLLGFPPMQMPPGSPPAPGLSPLMAVGGVIELGGGIMIMVGLFAGIAAFLASGMMAVAYFTSHYGLPAFLLTKIGMAQHPDLEPFLPFQNHGEPAVIYCFVFLYVAARGAGIWSVDSMRRGNRSYNRN